MISYWESGRDLNLSGDLFESFVRYQVMMRREFESMSRRNGFSTIDGQGSVRTVNWALRKGIAGLLGIRKSGYQPSPGLMRLWR